MRLRPVAILAAFLLPFLSPPAAAQQPVCGDRDHIASELLRQHGEKPVARGRAPIGAGQGTGLTNRIVGRTGGQ